LICYMLAFCWLFSKACQTIFRHATLSKRLAKPSSTLWANTGMDIQRTTSAIDSDFWAETWKKWSDENRFTSKPSQHVFRCCMPDFYDKNFNNTSARSSSEVFHNTSLPIWNTVTTLYGLGPIPIVPENSWLRKKSECSNGFANSAVEFAILWKSIEVCYVICRSFGNLPELFREFNFLHISISAPFAALGSQSWIQYDGCNHIRTKCFQLGTFSRSWMFSVEFSREHLKNSWEKESEDYLQKQGRSANCWPHSSPVFFRHCYVKCREWRETDCPPLKVVAIS
jgi:hypothetical protein